MALELVRLLHSPACSIYLTDSIGMAFPRYSCFVKKYLRSPHASDEPEQFIRYLLRIIDEYEIDILLPTNEEIFYIAQYLDAIAGKCQVISDDFEKLRTLHHKYEMTTAISGCHMKTPETYLLKEPADLSPFKSASRDFIFKPVYSRFADKVLITPSTGALQKITLDPANPYVAQHFITGQELCSFSIAVKGKITAHTTYVHPYKMGKGSGIYNIRVADKKIESFCKKVCARLHFTGQIGFDYLRDKTGDYYVIDCNPRTTSGIHFFHPKDGLLDALLGKNNQPIQSTGDPIQMNGLTLLTLHGPKAILTGELPAFHSRISSAHDIIFRPNDPKPFFGQLLTLWEFLRLSQKRKIPFQEAFYHGNAWNGQWQRKKSNYHQF